MRIGIQVSSDFKKRTGVEEYVFQLLEHLPAIDDFKNHQFFLYHRENLKWPFKKGWTQLRLSWEILRKKPDVLFVPAHTFPLIHPKKLVVAIQGLEYEAVPELYPFWEKIKTRFLTKRNIKKTEKIIVPSECTKQDLIDYYKVDSKKIFVIPHGVTVQNTKSKIQNDSLKFKKYILYLGSGHKRKNVDGLKKAYKILKEKYRTPHKLILAGVNKYVGHNEKWELLKNTDIFVFPSFYEGFGFPVLEAQSVGAPVVASNTSSFPETLKDSALLVNPKSPKEIAEAIYKVLSDENTRNELIKRGRENVKRFSWQNCAQETLKILCE